MIKKESPVMAKSKWWKAVVLGKLKGRKFLAVYMWEKRNDQWKQKHKLKLNRKADWIELKPVIEDMIERL